MTQQKSGGFVLLEVLVALLIFSLGLLGMIGFQASAAKIASDSRFRTEAAMLADELIGRMSMSDISKVKTAYATGGSELSAWVTNRVQGGSRLPNASVTTTFGTQFITAATVSVTVRITWDMPGSSGSDGDPLHGVYMTQTMLF